jgi:hypothetical protein
MVGLRGGRGTGPADHPDDRRPACPARGPRKSDQDAEDGVIDLYSLIYYRGLKEDLIAYGNFSKFELKFILMNTLNIENKEYVVISRKEYEDLRTKATVKTVSAKKLSLTEGKKLAYKLIDKWAKGK